MTGLLTVQEAAERLSVGVLDIYDMAARGVLQRRPLVVGDSRRLRVTKASVEALAALQ